MATMIHFSNITKQFPGNKALDSVDFNANDAIEFGIAIISQRVRPLADISKRG